MSQEEGNKTRRWLLPFTTGVDLPAIDTALRLAETGGATLVAVSFITIPGEQRSQSVRLELIQQSKDFLEAIRYKSLRLSIPVECYEMFTSDVPGCITTQIHELSCDALVLASRGKEVLFLGAHEVRHVFLEPPVPLVLLRFPAPAISGLRPRLGARLLSRVQRRPRLLSASSSHGNKRGEIAGKILTIPWKKEA